MKKKYPENRLSLASGSKLIAHAYQAREKVSLKKFIGSKFTPPRTTKMMLFLKVKITIFNVVCALVHALTTHLKW